MPQVSAFLDSVGLACPANYNLADYLSRSCGQKSPSTPILYVYDPILLVDITTPGGELLQEDYQDDLHQRDMEPNEVEGLYLVKNSGKSVEFIRNSYAQSPTAEQIRIETDEIKARFAK